MARPVTVLREIEKVGRIYDFVQTRRHNGYPIVDKYDPELEDDDLTGVMCTVSSTANYDQFVSALGSAKRIMQLLVPRITKLN